MPGICGGLSQLSGLKCAKYPGVYRCQMLRILSKQLIKTTMEREEMQLGEKSNLNFTNQFNLLDLSLTKQEYNLMELGSSSQRQWRYSMACPTDNQLSWLGR